MRRVSIGMHYKTIHDVNDGFGGKTGACSECTLPREDPDSELIAWIGGHTNIGPVLQVRTICCFDQYGVETTGTVNISRRIQILNYRIQRLKPLRGGDTES